MAIIQKKKTSPNKRNLYWDTLLLSLFILAQISEDIGQGIHEWIGVSLGVGVLVHLVLHFKWLVQVTKRFFGKLPTKVRINYLLTGLLLLNIGVIGASGMMMSETAFPSLGLQFNGGDLWEDIHEVAASSFWAVIGVHLALHFKWILTSIKKHNVKSKPMVKVAQLSKT